MVGNFRGAPAGVPAPLIGQGDYQVPNTQQGQKFKTYPVPNFNLASYQLQIRGSSTGTTANNSSVVDSYIFPLSPENVRKEYQGLTNFYDLQGDATNNGVLRVVDIYGLTPPIFVIEGTTGWKLHQADGFRFTGLQSISRIESLLSTYATVNQQQIQAGNPTMYELWFFDFYRNEFWAVHPIGPQGIRQTVARPQLVNYAFRFVATRRLDTPGQALPDNLAATLTASSATQSTVFQGFMSSFTATYTPVTVPAQ